MLSTSRLLTVALGGTALADTCHWQSCSNNAISGWCAESKSNCLSCGGGVWCPSGGGGGAPSPPPASPAVEYCPDPAQDFHEEVEGPPGQVTWSSSGWHIQGQRRVSSKASYDLRGGSIEWDMDVSQARGGTNNNFYLAFPRQENSGINSYCDSGGTGGCAELDLTENNGGCFAQSTVHNDFNGGDKGGRVIGSGALDGGTVHMKATWDQDGNTMSVQIGNNHYSGPGEGQNMESFGAVIYSSQWVGWVPGNCGGDGNLQASSFGVSNLKITGRVKQGPKPKPCKAPTPAKAPTPSKAPTPASPPTPSAVPSAPGAIVINEDGKENVYYFYPHANVIDSGKTVKYEPPLRFYLMKEQVEAYTNNASKFYKPKFLGKTFSVDVEYSRDGEEPAGCGCNINFYLVDMPVASPGKDNDYYCDAQCFPDMGCCAEFDMNEMNANIVQTTNHACAGPYDGHPDWKCDKWGTPVDKTDHGAFGIGPDHTIDTKKKFTFSQQFRMDGDRLTVATTMTQEGKQTTLTLNSHEQLQAMMRSGSLEKGMAFVTGYWFDEDMTWMDGGYPGCNKPETCNKSPVYLSNWRITTNSDVPPLPPSPSSPSPSGGSSQGSCHWQSCSSNAIPGWCSESQSQCSGCGGGVWCTGGSALASVITV